MRFFGLEITKASPRSLSPVPPGSGSWWPLIREPFTGAWQRNLEVRAETVLTYSAVFRCISLIASDVAKMRVRLVQQDSNGIWKETQAAAFSPVLRKPNRYQNHIQFFGSWMESKLVHGNAYILKERDARSVVTGLYALDPTLVTVLVAPDGAVYYELQADNLAGIPNGTLTVPASEIIHDRMNAFNHPLVGISPIMAAGLAAQTGLSIQQSSAKFFANGSLPGGLLSAPGRIQPDTAERLKEYWNHEYGAGGNSVGKVAVLGDGLKYEPMMITAVDAQMLEQLRWTAETVASVFGVPAYKIGVAAAPTYNNIEALDAQYYSQCLQIHLESIEECLDDGLGLGPRFGNTYGTEFDLDSLLRMDTSTKVRSAAEAVKAGFLAPNEARFQFDLPPVEGGDSPYLQVQNYSLKALNKRDQQDSPVTPGLPPGQPSTETIGDGRKPSSPPADANPTDHGADAERQRFIRGRLVGELADIITRSVRDHESRRSAA